MQYLCEPSSHNYLIYYPPVNWGLEFILFQFLESVSSLSLLNLVLCSLDL